MNLLKSILFCGMVAAATVPVLSSQVAEPSAEPVASEAVSASSQSSDAATMHRPRIGLTFAGGGAKGAAHIGVLKVLEEVGIPIDYITGTSMGSIIGMLYSLGYSANQMDTIISNIDWGVYMSDRMDRRYTNSVKAEMDGTMLISLPFNTGTLSSQVSDIEQNHDIAQGDKRDIKKEATGASDSKVSFLSSLPGGFTTGSNLLNLFNCLSVGYQDSMSFDDLPIPYACVVSDVVSGQMKVLRSGWLPDAVRASMAIPGVFAPVRYGKDMMLVDGGLFNNFPVDVCQEMGADIVIGVEVTKDRGDVHPDAIKSLPELLTRLFDMMTRKGTAENQQRCTIYVHPDISGFGTLSFDKESVKAIMERGYAAASEKREMLEALKAQLDKFPKEKTRKAPPAKNLSPFSETAIKVSSVTVEGMNEVLKNRMIQKSGVDFSKEVTGKDLNRLVGIIYGTAAFKRINYYLSPNADGTYALTLKTTPEEPHEIGLGFRYDTRDQATLLLHLGLGENKMTGFSGSTTWNLGANLRGNLMFSYAPLIFPTINLAFNYHGYENVVSQFGNNYYRMRIHEMNAELYLSQFHSRFIRAEGGLRLQSRSIKDIFFDDEYTMSYIQIATIDPYVGQLFVESMENQSEKLSSCPLGIFARFKFDNLDKEYFARKGVKFQVLGEWNFLELYRLAREEGMKVPNMGSLQLNLESYIPLTSKLELIPQFYGRHYLGGDRENEHYSTYTNYIGGSLSGRYSPQQMPFIGTNTVESMNNLTTIFRADLRWNMVGRHYLTGMFNYCRSAYGISEWFKDSDWADSFYGAGIEYAYNSIIGPIKLDVHWGNTYRVAKFWDQVGAYLSIGYNF